MMRKHQGIAAFTTMAMSAGVALVLAWASATPAVAGGGVLRARFNADIRSTDPGTNRDANTDGVMGHVIEGLVAFREDLNAAITCCEKSAKNENRKPLKPRRSAEG